MQQPPSQQTQGAGGAASELRSDAQQIGSKAKERIHSEVDARKDTAATQAKSVSSAIQRVAGELDDDTPSWLKSAFRQGAEQIQRFADTIEQKDSRELVREVQSFARERPALFLGACAAAGFAAARIFKAGGEQQSAQQFSGTGQWDQDRGFDERLDPGTASARRSASGEQQPFSASDEDRGLGTDDPLILGSAPGTRTPQGEPL